MGKMFCEWSEHQRGGGICSKIGSDSGIGGDVGYNMELWIRIWSENAEQLWYHVTMRILEMGFGQMTKNSELMMRKAVSENLLAFLPRTAIVSHCAQVILHSIILASALTRNIWITSQETKPREQGFAGKLYLPLIWWEQPFHQNWSYHWVKSHSMGQIHLT